jgi:hypothetical protein
VDLLVASHRHKRIERIPVRIAATDQVYLTLSLAVAASARRLRAQRLGLGDIRRIQFQFKTTKHDEIIQESMLP